MQKVRYSSFDFVKGLAIFLVVVSHSIFYYYSQSMGYLIIRNISCSTMPAFFLISGFLFGKKTVGSKDADAYKKRYILKTVKIYLAWAAFFVVLQCVSDFVTAYAGGRPFASSIIDLHKFALGPVSIFKQIVFLLFDFGYFSYGIVHLWFLLAIVWSFVILSFFIRIKKPYLLLAISLGLNLTGLFFDSYRTVFRTSLFMNSPLNGRNALSYGLLYCTLGYCFSLNEEKLAKLADRLKNTYLALLCALLFGLMFCEQLFVMHISTHTDHDYDFFLSTIPLAVVIFLLTFKNRAKGGSSFVAKIGRKTLGIYLIHPALILGLNTSILILHLDLGNIALQAIEPFVILLLSMYAYDLIQFVKKKILTGFAPEAARKAIPVSSAGQNLP